MHFFAYAVIYTVANLAPAVNNWHNDLNVKIIANNFTDIQSTWFEVCNYLHIC